MNSEGISVRELQKKDIEPLSNYWLNADAGYMRGMGVDVSKLPTREEWNKMLTEQLSQDYKNKKSYAIIWELDGEAIGHSNINKIIFGEEAYMHLHLWNNTLRKKGIGTALVKLTLPYYFKNFGLKKLYVEPYALNPAPVKTLERAGFTFLRKYTCVPGFICFEQEVSLWELSREDFERNL